MYSPIFLAVMVLIMMSITTALQIKDAEPRSCYLCDKDCNRAPATVGVCPRDRPFCATVAASPNFTSFLICAAGGNRPCSLTYTSQQTYKLTCVCSHHLCNSPFSRELQHELMVASATNKNDSADVAEAFWKQSHFFNFNESYIHQINTAEALAEDIDAKMSDDVELIMISANPTMRAQTEDMMPEVAALKKETTVPSDDDEDESEGSGIYDDTHASHRPEPPVTPTPTPSLPTPENSAPNLLFNLFEFSAVATLLVII